MSPRHRGFLVPQFSHSHELRVAFRSGPAVWGLLRRGRDVHGHADERTAAARGSPRWCGATMVISLALPRGAGAHVCSLALGTEQDECFNWVAIG